ncbi:MAG: metal ABC transporter ATP-binding protein [Spirochaetaceae bacterium]|jgi:zinc transport system ATP-binding protein|nr:metal ABC transporter ATP-binding protein [Spirochaetaceae bacterium]
METLITCEDAAFSYDGRPAASALNFSVRRGDFLCVAGENGSGKSTLAKGIAGLLAPSSGRVTLSSSLARCGIGYLAQQSAFKTDFPAGVMEIVLSGFLGKTGLRPFYTKAEKSKALGYMEELGVASYSKSGFSELSGGQQRRVLIARALCASVSVLLLDEPAAGLDPLVSADLYSLVSALNKSAGYTIIMISHELETTLAYATAVLHLQHTQLFFGSVEDYRLSEVGRRFLRRP